MKRLVLWLLSFCLLTGCAAPAASPALEEPVELVVFAAASLTESLTEIAEAYKTVAPNVTLVFNFDSSGTLKTQIESGAACDLFLSAAPKQMNQLDASKPTDVNPGGLDFVLQGTRTDLLENKVALVVPEGNPKGVGSFGDLVEKLKNEELLLAVGNADVPVGQYTQKIFAYYGIDEADIASKLTYGSNVKEVTAQVSEGAADCGIVYATDAFSAGLTIVDTATKDLCGQVIYPAAVLNTTEHESEAKAFLAYLESDEAGAIFLRVGFTPLHAQ
ncbi:MAG: molybdate ABC transporter substrate-binding protein [Clostridia bacterium]|nr:molybdate ABC transporter substrate-binding protein [Clostridia bacterium]